MAEKCQRWRPNSGGTEQFGQWWLNTGGVRQWPEQRQVTIGGYDGRLAVAVENN
mgnify:CR=1 FL=1